MPQYPTSYLVPASLNPPAPIPRGNSLPATGSSGANFILLVSSGNLVAGLYIWNTVKNAWVFNKPIVESGTDLPTSGSDHQHFYLTAASGSLAAGVYIYSTATSTWTFVTATNPNSFLDPPVFDPNAPPIPPYLLEDIYFRGGLRIAADPTEP